MIINSQSNSVIKTKGKKNKSMMKDNKNKMNKGMNKSASQIIMTNNKSSLINNYYDRDYRVQNAETKIVKRVNKKDYNEDAVYGKPSNVFIINKPVIIRQYYQDNNNRRTFKKFNSQSQGRYPDINTCEICREMYKKMIMNKEEFKPLKCPNCGNVLNEELYHYYLQLYSVPQVKISSNRYLDEGKMTGEWTKWIQLQTELRKENLAYDIVNGNEKIQKQNEKDEQLKKMISTTKGILKRVNKPQK